MDMTQSEHNPWQRIANQPLWTPRYDPPYQELEVEFMRTYYPNIEEIIQATGEYEQIFSAHYQFDPDGPGYAQSILKVLMNDIVMDQLNREHVLMIASYDAYGPADVFMLRPQKLNFECFGKASRLLWGYVVAAPEEKDTLECGVLVDKNEMVIRATFAGHSVSFFGLYVLRGYPLGSSNWGVPLSFMHIPNADELDPLIYAY